jgi:hypothetical protein
MRNYLQRSVLGHEQEQGDVNLIYNSKRLKFELDDMFTSNSNFDLFEFDVMLNSKRLEIE